MQSDPKHSVTHSDSLPRLILDALPATMRVVAAQMRETKHNLHSGHLPVLAALSRQPFTQSELAEMMSVSGATMSNTLTALEERGWIIRERSSEDRRVVQISLAEAGAVALSETMREMEAYLERLLSELTNEERRELARGLVILREVFLRVLGTED
jgi:DNA-binding MarR family transcriptional regulator